MIKYAKIIKDDGLCDVAFGTNEEYYKSIGFALLDVEQSDVDNNWYLKSKCPHKLPEELLRERKEERLAENETIREAYLVEGVTYKDVLFDSDLEQKLNIMATVNAMSETDTITWVGKDGITSLECTKADLIAIGELLTKMTTYVWQYRNPQIKLAIEDAETIEEVNAVDISYERIVAE